MGASLLLSAPASSVMTSPQPEVAPQPEVQPVDAPQPEVQPVDAPQPLLQSDAAGSQQAGSGAQQFEACLARKRASSPPPQLCLNKRPENNPPPQLFTCRRANKPPPQCPASAVVSVVASAAPITSANAAMPLTTVRFIENLPRVRSAWCDPNSHILIRARSWGPTLFDG